ncbi:hypothetical protein IL306_011976 [Fusarium sp. DS 682]|nr:hypothetical protein IL306_011976 [Fusarium sp. DS 682]
MASPNDKIWIKYALGIKTWSGKDGNPDPNSMYFIASAINKGPAAGSFVPDANMNNVLYLNAKNEDQGLKQQLDEAKKKYDEVEKEYFDIEDKARPMGEGLTFWSTHRAEEIAQLMLRIYGPDTQKLNSQKNELLQVSDKTRFTNGLSMMSSLDQISPVDYEKYYKAVQDGTIGTLPPLKAVGTFNRPAYSIDPTYKTTMDQWAKVPLDAEDEFTWTIKSSQLDESSWKKLGHVDGRISFGYWFIRLGVGAGKDWEEPDVTKEVRLLRDSAQRSASWSLQCQSRNVKSFRLAYPNIDGDVGIAKNAVQPTQLFCASRVKIKVKFTGEMEKEFEKNVTDAKAGKVGISILGFRIGAGGGTTEKETTHTSNLVKEDGWYKMEPTLVNGGCSMLAVIGSRLDKH